MRHLEVVAPQGGDRGELVRRQDEEAGDEDRLGDPAAPVLGGLERLSGRLREAVQVEAVVPVGAADERQAVRPSAFEGVADRSPEVLVERALAARLVVERHGHLQDRGVARLLQVGGHGQDEPGRVVVEPGAHVVVAALGERLVLVVGAAARKLGCRQVQQPLAGARRDHVDEAEHVLARVAESHPPPDARLEQRRGAGKVERDHALVRVPGVDHPVDVLVPGRDLAGREQVGPARLQRLEGLGHRGGIPVAVDQRPDAPLVDHLRTGWVELGVARVLGVAEEEDDLPGLAGAELESDVVRARRLPAVGDRARGLAALDGDRPVPAPVGPQEGVALRVEAGEGLRAGEEGEVVAPLAILGLVVDDAVLDLHLPHGVVALEVGGVVLGVPEAELHRAEEGQRCRPGAARSSGGRARSRGSRRAGRSRASRRGCRGSGRR